MDTPRQMMSRADRKALLFGERYKNPHPSFLPKEARMGDIDGTSFVPNSMVTKEATVRFQSKMTGPEPTEWVPSHPQVWLAEVLEIVHEHSPNFYIVLDPDTTMEVHWRIKPRDTALIEEIRAVMLDSVGPVYKEREVRRAASAVYDRLVEKGLLNE